MSLPVLWHFPISHYNEKVRWALDFKRIPHRRRALVMDYVPRTLWKTGQTIVGYRESLAGRRGFHWVADIHRRHRGTSAEVAA